MKTFRVIKRIDAYKNYTAAVEAETEAEALLLAQQDYHYGGSISWQEDSIDEFDEVTFEVIND